MLGLRRAWVLALPIHPLLGLSPILAAHSFSCTVFTFGQTGSGKTYTLTGPPPQVGSLVKPVVVVGGTPGWKGSG